MKTNVDEVSRASDGSVAVGGDELTADNATTAERVEAGLKSILTGEEIQAMKDRCCEYAQAGKWCELQKLASMVGQAGFSYQELKSLMK
jgi:hypothetical protein